MTNSEKGELFKNKLDELINYKTKLMVDNLDDFNNLIKEILVLLNDNQKLKFNQFTFYNEIPDYSDADNDLPF